jgi:hypothetical protein
VAKGSTGKAVTYLLPGAGNGTVRYHIDVQVEVILAN